MLARRSFLLSLAASTAALPLVAPVLVRAAPKGGSTKTLVVLFQRGAVDGLSMVPPIADAAYYAARPTIAIPKKSAKPLDATFGLHPALASLEPFWSKGSLAIVHAVGSPDGTRSHFDAQDAVETGTPGVKTTDDGWLARLLDAGPEPDGKALRAVALSPTLPRILRGDADAVAFASFADFKVAGKNAGAGTFEAMYEGALDEALRGAGHDAFEAMDALEKKGVAKLEPKNGAKYPESPLGKRLRQIAQLIRGDVGVEVAFTDQGGWDTHANQGGPNGALAKRLEDLGSSIAAFATDLGDGMKDVCLVTVTEFGRTVKENGTGGTDHGHGSVMMVLGGGVKGGKKVLGTWKGLAPDVLHEGRDLPVTTDHRSVFAEVVGKHLGAKDLSTVFPGFTPTKVGLF